MEREEIEKIIRENLIDGQWFVPKEWKVPQLYFKEFHWDPEIDHEWHEFETIESTTKEITEELSIEDFLLLVSKTV